MYYILFVRPHLEYDNTARYPVLRINNELMEDAQRRTQKYTCPRIE